jgi:hypothetical protein
MLFRSADAQTDVADHFGAEALLHLTKNLGLGDLLEFVMQCLLKRALHFLSFNPRCSVSDVVRSEKDGNFQPTLKRMSRMVLLPKRCFSFRRISDLEICSSS